MHRKRVKKMELKKKYTINSTKDCEDTSQPMLTAHPAADITHAASRWELKRAIMALCEQLVAIGEEYFLVTANISSGWISHFGSGKGQDYIEEQSDIAWNFYRYCLNEEFSTEDPEIEVEGDDINHTDVSCLDMDQEFLELMDSDSSDISKEDYMSDSKEHHDIKRLDEYKQTTETSFCTLRRSEWNTSDKSELKMPPLQKELVKTQVMSVGKKSTNRRKRTGVKKTMYVDVDYFDSDVDDHLNSDNTIDKEEKLLEIGIKTNFSSKREQDEREESGTSDLSSKQKTKTQFSGRKRQKQKLEKRHWVDSEEMEEDETSALTPPNG